MLHKLLFIVIFLCLNGTDLATNIPQSVFARTTLSIDNQRDEAIREDISRIADIISEFVRLRTEFRRFDIGSKDYKGSVWYHTGVMRNPLTGLEVAGIEGIEFTMPIILQHNRMAAIGSASTPEPEHNWMSRSYYSRKLFVYVDPKNRTSPINHFKVNKLSPSRAVNPLKIIYEIVTLGIDANRKAFTQVEFPSGRLLRSNKIKIVAAEKKVLPKVAAIVSNSNPGGSYSSANGIRASGNNAKDKESSGYPHGGIMGGRNFDIVHFISAARKKSFNRWISFSPVSDGSGRSQEYYSLTPSDFLRSIPLVSSLIAKMGIISSFPPLATLSYKRYGECPSWFSVGRSCSIEMQAFKFNSLEQLPPHMLALVQRIGCKYFLDEENFCNRYGYYYPSHGGGAVPTATSTSTVTENRLYNSFRRKADALDNFKPWYSSLLGVRKSWFKR